MPLGEYLMYQAGYVTASDVAAQQRCFTCLNQALVIVNKQVSEGDNAARTELTQLRSVHSLLKDLAGSYQWQKAESFWRYWDKNKQQIIRIVHSSDNYLDEVGKLEEGRRNPE